MCSGCIEPPVTPVGRDELELKRQRLYTELLRAAHAAVEHSVAVRGMTASIASDGSPSPFLLVCWTFLVSVGVGWVFLELIC